MAQQSSRVHSGCISSARARGQCCMVVFGYMLAALVLVHHWSGFAWSIPLLVSRQAQRVIQRHLAYPALPASQLPAKLAQIGSGSSDRCHTLSRLAHHRRRDGVVAGYAKSASSSPGRDCRVGAALASRASRRTGVAQTRRAWERHGSRTCHGVERFSVKIGAHLGYFQK